jgi:hypothetical protein
MIFLMSAKGVPTMMLMTRLLGDMQSVITWCQKYSWLTSFGCGYLTTVFSPPIALEIVDQSLILPETIITSFPQNWNQDPNKPEQRDVLNNIQRILLQPDRRPLLTVFDLAALIVQQCTAVFDRNAIKSKELQFMDMFEASIEEIVSHAASISE